MNPASAQGVVRTYVVVPGDTLSGIAKKTGLSVKTLEDANPGTDPLRLKIGKKLKIPEGAASAAADKP
jgi:LysM repeat protein